MQKAQKENLNINMYILNICDGLTGCSTNLLGKAVS